MNNYENMKILLHNVFVIFIDKFVKVKSSICIYFVFAGEIKI